MEDALFTGRNVLIDTASFITAGAIDTQSLFFIHEVSVFYGSNESEGEVYFCAGLNSQGVPMIKDFNALPNYHNGTLYIMGIAPK